MTDYENKEMTHVPLFIALFGCYFADFMKWGNGFLTRDLTYEMRVSNHKATHPVVKNLGIQF
jgi:hypothetical protein